MTKIQATKLFKQTGLKTEYWGWFLINLAIEHRIPWHRIADTRWSKI